MLTISEVLQRARLNQGIDLATVAARTRIKTKYLQAIEADDRESLPGEFFYKSFVHQYATFLGVDTRAIDAEVDRVLNLDAPPPLPTTTEQALKASSWSWPSGKYVSYAALVLVLVACYAIDSWWHKSDTPVAQNTSAPRPANPTAKHVSVAPTPKPAARPSQAAPVIAAVKQAAPAAPAGSGVQLALTATEETWLSVSSDGTPVFSGLLEANQTKTIEGKESAKLKVGNAAGLEARLNGRPLGPLGAHGQVRELLVTPDKFQFVSEPKDIE
jgi:cytoskeleton protein RodZ